MPQTKRRSTARPANRRSKSKRTKTYTYTIKIHPVDSDEMGFWVEVPALPGCFTQGETIEECLERAHEAIAGHVQSLVELNQPVPEETKEDDAVISKVRVNLPMSVGAACPRSQPGVWWQR